MMVELMHAPIAEGAVLRVFKHMRLTDRAVKLGVLHQEEGRLRIVMAAQRSFKFHGGVIGHTFRHYSSEVNHTSVCNEVKSAEQN